MCNQLAAEEAEDSENERIQYYAQRRYAVTFTGDF